QHRNREADIGLLLRHHGSMPPSKPSQNQPKSGNGKGKTGKDGPQTSNIDFGLPPTVVTALQSISTRATQDLWGTAAFQSDSLTAEQIAQRRSNLAGKLSKRITGDTKAKQDLAIAVGEWFSQISQHLLGLLGRMRAIGSKLDEDLSAAVQEMQQYLIEQPSSTTEEQLLAATNSMGPVWSPPQEQEVVKLSAALRAFSAVRPTQLPLSTAASSAHGPQLLFNQPDQRDHMAAAGGIMAGAAIPGAAPDSQPSSTFPLDQTSEASFGGHMPMDPSTAAVASRGQRWKRRNAGSGQRPSKSPRRDLEALASPWRVDATGRTPEGARREPHTQMEDEPELLPDHDHRTSSSPPSWWHFWLQLISFAVEHGADRVGDLAVDEAQNAFLPLSESTGDAQAVCQQVRQGVILAAHITLGSVVTLTALMLPSPGLGTIVLDTQPVPSTRDATEVRMRGCFLHNAILVALGRDRHTSRCLQVFPPLPHMPQEQYIVSSTLQHWNELAVPVDLRPLGGGISAHSVPCTATGADVIAAAAATQRLHVPQHYYCQAGVTIMHPAAQVLLIPGGTSVRGLLPSDVQTVALTHADPSPASPGAAVTSTEVLTESMRTVAVIYPGGILLHDVTGDGFADSDRARTMREIRGDLGLTEPVFLRPQLPLAALPGTQLIALELEDVDRSVLVDFRGIGGGLSFATVLPGATSNTCLLEADLPTCEALPALLRAGWLKISDSGLQNQHLPSRRGIRVITVDWKVIPRESPPILDSALAHEDPQSGSQGSTPSLPLWISVALVSRNRLLAGVLLCVGLLGRFQFRAHPDDMWLVPEQPASTIFRGSLDLVSVTTHQRYVNLLHSQPAEALPPSSHIAGRLERIGTQVCIQVWTPDKTHQFTLAADDMATQLQHRLRLTDPTGQRRIPALVLPQLMWPCIQFVAPHKDPELVTILVDLGYRIYCLDVTRHRLAADLFQQLRQKCGHEEFRINRGLVASVRHGELLRVFSEQATEVAEVGRISFHPVPPSVSWLGVEDQVYVVGPFLDLVRIIPAPAEPETSIPALLLSTYGVTGVLYRIPPLPAGYHFPTPVFCFTPQDTSCHVVIAADVLGLWQRLVIQASVFTSWPGDALDDLASEARPFHAFWRRVRDSLPVLYPVADPTLGYTPWGLRIGIAVFGVCTAEVTWQHVLTIAEANPWDLSGMEIMGDHDLWTWPDDIQGLAGQCGHLLQSGSDPFLCAASSEARPSLRPAPSNAQPLSGSSTTREHIGRIALERASNTRCFMCHLATASSPQRCPTYNTHSSVSAPGAHTWGTSGAEEPVDEEDNGIAPVLNTTRTCTVA
ncbi:unnamed protein product, partial [Symbiodinium necroappetens]